MKPLATIGWVLIVGGTLLIIGGLLIIGADGVVRVQYGRAPAWMVTSYGVVGAIVGIVCAVADVPFA